MAFRMRGDSDVPVRPRPDEVSEFSRGVECLAWGLDALRQVAPKGKDVIDAVFLVILDDCGDFVARVGHAGQVGHRFDLEVVADGSDPVASRASSGAAGPVGDRHELWTVFREAVEGLFQAFGAGFVTWSREFEGQRLARIKQARDAGHTGSTHPLPLPEEEGIWGLDAGASLGGAARVGSVEARTAGAGV